MQKMNHLTLQPLDYVNSIRGFLLGFFIFRGERITNDYIKNCVRDMCGNVDKNMDDIFHFQGILVIFHKVNS